MTLQLSAAAQMLGGLKPHSMTMGDDLFDLIHRELFPSDDDNPNLADIFAKNLQAGVCALEHTGLPLITSDGLFIVCAEHTLGNIMHHPKVLPLIKMQRLQSVAQALQNTRVKNFQRLHDTLGKRRDHLRGVRNKLDGFDFYIAHRNKRHSQHIVQEEQPSLFDIPLLEDTLRGLSVVAYLESAIFALVHRDWADFSKAAQGILRAGWGNNQPHIRHHHAPFLWKNSAQETKARQRIGLTFFEFYAKGGEHEKPNWMKAVWH